MDTIGYGFLHFPPCNLSPKASKSLNKVDKSLMESLAQLASSYSENETVRIYPSSSRSAHALIRDLISIEKVASGQAFKVITRVYINAPSSSSPSPSSSSVSSIAKESAYNPQVEEWVGNGMSVVFLLCIPSTINISALHDGYVDIANSTGTDATTWPIWPVGTEHRLYEKSVSSAPSFLKLIAWLSNDWKKLRGIFDEESIFFKLTHLTPEVVVCDNVISIEYNSIMKMITNSMKSNQNQ